MFVISYCGSNIYNYLKGERWDILILSFVLVASWIFLVSDRTTRLQKNTDASNQRVAGAKSSCSDF